MSNPNPAAVAGAGFSNVTALLNAEPSGFVRSNLLVLGLYLGLTGELYFARVILVGILTSAGIWMKFRYTSPPSVLYALDRFSA